MCLWWFHMVYQHLHVSKLWYICCWFTLLWCYVLLITHSYLYLFSMYTSIHVYIHSSRNPIHLHVHTLWYICCLILISFCLHTRTRIHLHASTFSQKPSRVHICVCVIMYDIICVYDYQYSISEYTYMYIWQYMYLHIWSRCWWWSMCLCWRVCVCVYPNVSMIMCVWWRVRVVLYILGWPTRRLLARYQHSLRYVVYVSPICAYHHLLHAYVCKWEHTHKKETTYLYVNMRVSRAEQG